jgi:D-beta-D-heptose 7-phosphate kinase/D-beta-D-heptose 1-phosphate adenosyltransferase
MKLDFSSTKILVLGDVMLDSYWHGSTSRISPEAPVPIVHITEFEERAGGAANVALNLSSLGSEVYLLGIVGTDKQAQSLETNLVAASINCNFQKVTAMQTINKVRVFSQHQQLLRIDFENYFNGVDISRLIQYFQEQLPLIDVVILSDYGKGTLYQIEKFISLARAANKPVLIDPKGCDFSKYSGASLITPNLSEFEAVVGKCNDESEIVEKAEQLRMSLNLEAILITRGEHGMSLIRKNNRPFHLPTHAREVFDVTGAGDTVIATFAASLTVGKDMEEAIQIANLAAGIVVGKLGSATTNITELYQAWDRNK